MIREHVKQSIRDELYAAFSDVAKPNVIHSCDCCHSEEEKAQLLQGTQRDVPKDLLYSLELDWISTLGDEKDFYYFTPCILDAYLSESPLVIEHLLELWIDSGLLHWPPAQQKAFKRAYTAICKAYYHKEVPEVVRTL